MEKTVIRASRRSKYVIIVAGGVQSAQSLPEIRRADIVIGVDRGALWLIEHGVVPEVAVGDFDSVTGSEKRRIHDRVPRYVEFSRDKDATDLELGLEEAMRYRPARVAIYGALGRRFDHAYGAVQLLRKLVSHNIYGEIVDNYNKIMIVRRGQQKISRDSTYPYLSVLPLTASADVTIEGCAYDVRRTIFDSSSTLGVSNRIVAAIACITVHRGQALIVRSRDASG